MSRVFVIQNPSVRRKGEWVSKYDLGDAYRFGTLDILLPPGNIPNVPEAREHVKAKLDTYTLDDFILAVGDPVAISLVSMMASRSTGGAVKLLKWDPRGRFYSAYLIDIR